MIICFITAKINAINYEDLLEDILIEFSEGLPNENWIFQQDNATIHTARSVKQWFQEKKIRVLDWPARSPDLNPIENLWHDYWHERYMEILDSMERYFKNYEKKNLRIN